MDHIAEEAASTDESNRDTEASSHSLPYAISSRLGQAGGANFPIYLDLTDLLFHFSFNRTPTGIQRVVMALAEAAMQQAGETVHLCALEPDGFSWKVLDSETVLHAFRQSHDSGSTMFWRAALAAIDDKSRGGLQFPANSIVVAPGSPWALNTYFTAVAEAKRQYSIHYVPFVHDLVPLLFPEYCQPSTPSDFLRWLACVGGLADLVIANSQSTKSDLAHMMNRLGGTPIPCEVVAPDGNFSELQRAADDEIIPSDFPKRFVLFVGTIEPRKNHLLVLMAWRNLLRSLGTDSVPTLVLAGSFGWGCEETKGFLEKTGNLGGKILLVQQATDGFLRALYAKAMFTIYNSHYEGWGLPVTESLSYGKVPVIPRNSALIESGRDYAVYFDTNSEPSLTEAIRGLLVAPCRIPCSSTEMDTRGVRSWADVFSQLRSTVRESCTKRPVRSENSTGGVIAMGQIYRAGMLSFQSSRNGSSWPEPAGFQRFRTAQDARRPSQWHGVEEWGVWSRAQVIDLTFILRDTAESYVNVYVHLLGHRDDCEIHWRIDQVSFPAVHLSANEEKLICLTFPSEIGRETTISAQCVQSHLCDLAKHGSADKRHIGIGLRAFMVCREADVESRLGIVEYWLKERQRDCFQEQAVPSRPALEALDPIETFAAGVPQTAALQLAANVASERACPSTISSAVTISKPYATIEVTDQRLRGSALSPVR